MRSLLFTLSILFRCLLPLSAQVVPRPTDSDPYPLGWTANAPRDEIRPAFSFEPKGGPNSAGSLVVTHDQREGLDGWFQKSFAVSGGECYRFRVLRKISRVAAPRQSCLVRISWQDATGKSVNDDARPEHADPRLPIPSAEPEYPTDGATDAQGWTTVGGIYKSPAKAARAIVELHLQWAPGGRVEWNGAEFAKTAPPPARKVRLATIHYKPTGKSPRSNCEEFAPLIAEAGKQRADLLVLGETVPTVGPTKNPIETAEPVPGPSTEYFGQLAKQHHLHIVLSLYERDAHLVYNTAVLLGPDGKLIGKYRKVCLPPGEAANGIAPGRDYPVFETKFGKVGLMVCYDGFFPEVARELSNRGAEVIAWPVWGCNPKLAEARACENHVYLISSTFMEPEDGWMISAVFDHGGKPIAQAGKWGTVAIAEVDLSLPYHGPYNLGDFRSMVPRHRPISAVESTAVSKPVSAADTNTPAPAEDRVGFPKGYAKRFAVLRTVDREEGKKLVTIYGNASAASVTKPAQLPYPYGSIFVMETASTVKDAGGKPVKDASGALQKDKVLGLHVMRRGKDFGAPYAAKRSGEWEYVEYRADGSYITPPQKSASCAECHIKAGGGKDFVYHGRFAE